MNLRNLSRCLAVLGLIILIWAGFRPEPIPQYTTNFDKWTHAVAFFGLTLVLLFSFPRRYWFFVCVTALLIGLGIEAGQEWFLPKRTFDWEDFLADAAGVALAIPIYFSMCRIGKFL